MSKPTARTRKTKAPTPARKRVARKPKAGPTTAAAPAVEGETSGGIHFEVGGIEPVQAVKFARSRRRESDYQAVFTRMAELKKAGDAFTVKLKGDTTPGTLHNRLNAAMRRAAASGRLPVPPSGLKYAKKTTEGGDVAVYLEKA